MTEQEKSFDSSHGLKEILGFDPVSGERIEDEQVLWQIRDPNLRIPEEVMKEFTTWKSLLERPKIVPAPVRHLLAIDPAKLFSLEYHEQNGRSVYYRIYHYWVHNEEDQVIFEPQSFIGINPALSTVGYYQRSESYQFNFSNSNYWDLVDILDNSVAMNFAYNREKPGGNFESVSITASGDGALNTLTLVSPMWNYLGSDTTFRLPERHLETTVGPVSFNVTRSGDIYKTEVIRGAETLQVLTFSNRFNSPELINTIVDPLTLQDPQNAPCELDYSWRVANIPKILKPMNITWGKFLGDDRKKRPVS